jgi:hypothetical protein
MLGFYGAIIWLQRLVDYRLNLAVIASEARQSSTLLQKLDCRVATLLAMTQGAFKIKPTTRPTKKRPITDRLFAFINP